MQANHNFYWLCAVLTMAAQAAVADTDNSAVQRIVWNKQPIAVQLNVSDERRIQFRAPVSVGIPAAFHEIPWKELAFQSTREALQIWLDRRSAFEPSNTGKESGGGC